MTHEEIKQYLTDQGHEDALVFEDPAYDAAFIGTTSDGRAVYDFRKMVQCLEEEDHMTEDEAIEFIEFNTIRSLPYYPMSPVVFYPVEDM